VAGHVVESNHVFQHTASFVERAKSIVGGVTAQNGRAVTTTVFPFPLTERTAKLPKRNTFTGELRTAASQVLAIANSNNSGLQRLPRTAKIL